MSEEQGRTQPGRFQGEPVAPDRLASLIDPTPCEDTAFLGHPSPGATGRLFGGQVVAQALVAAMRSENEGRMAHSLHANFMRPGMAADPVEFVVSTPFDGRSFATRQVVATQDGAALLGMSVSFQRPEPGVEHRDAMPPVADPVEAREAFLRWNEEQRRRGAVDRVERFSRIPLDIVPLSTERLFGAQAVPPHAGWWLRLRAYCEPDAIVHRGLLAYASDFMLLRTCMLPHGLRWGMPNLQVASLDHALWFHETPDLNDWVLHVTDSPWAGHGRGLNRGRFFTRDGRLIASVMQEALIRSVAVDQ